MADVFTAAGEEKVADLVEAQNWWIAWGTGAGTAAKGDTALFTEASEDRVAATKSQPVADTNRFLAQLTATAAKTITNAGVFDALTTGNMLLKSDFTGIALDTGDKIQFTFDLQWS